MDGSNRSHGQRCMDALETAAEAKVKALAVRKLAERSFDAIFLKVTGKNVEERKAIARTHPAYIELDDRACLAEQDAVVAKARADGAQILFEEWRTSEATLRSIQQAR